MKSQLSKLPKELLIEIIEKQSFLDHYTYKECKQFREKIYERIDQLYKLYYARMRSMISDYIPKNLVGHGEDINYKYKRCVVSYGVIRLYYTYSYIYSSSLYLLSVNFFIHKGKWRSYFYTKELKSRNIENPEKNGEKNEEAGNEEAGNEEAGNEEEESQGKAESHYDLLIKYPEFTDLSNFLQLPEVLQLYNDFQ